MWKQLFKQHQNQPPLEASISVVVPLYNHQRYIEHALDSVLMQTLQANEIIVIDDGSQDDSAAIVEKYAKRESHVVLWRQANQGAHQAINTGIHLSRGEYVAILNSDDAYDSDRLSACVDYLARNPMVAAVATGLEFMDADGRAIENAWYAEVSAFYRRHEDIALALANGNFIMTTSNLVIRRSTFGKMGYFSSLRYAHDLDFMLRLLLSGQTLHILDRPLLRYRMHATNTIKENAAQVRLEWAAVVSFYIHSLMHRQLVGIDAWKAYQQLLDVAERHRLERLILLFLAYYAKLSPERTRSDAFLADPEFMRVLLETA